jgi:DNA-binding NtrC family response regulator
MAKILIVDDDRSIRSTLREIMEFEGYTVTDAKDGEEAVAILNKEQFAVVLCDIKMPKLDGIGLLTKAMEAGIDTQFIMISAHGNIETAVEATKLGAFDFLIKPPDLNKLLITVRNALKTNALEKETLQLKASVAPSNQMIGESTPIVQLRETIGKVAPTEARVLITGPNGSGKELVAMDIHRQSNRTKGPLVIVNCAAIPQELIESELFGHEKGSFTSAIKQRLGKFEQANGGTLFLDEIGDMDLSAQAKVLRALQEGKITKVGGEKEIKVDVRVIAATNKKLDKEIAAGNFRMDLYHRLSVILIHVPTLNERKDDIPILADRFCSEICEEYSMPKKVITPKAFKLLQEYDWTGNIRELKNVIERLIILSSGKITEEEVEQFAMKQGTHTNVKYNELFDKFMKFQEFKEFIEKEFIEYKLNKFNWNVSKTADEIDIQRSHLYNKIEKFELKRD